MNTPFCFMNPATYKKFLFICHIFLLPAYAEAAQLDDHRGFMAGITLLFFGIPFAIINSPITIVLLILKKYKSSSLTIVHAVIMILAICFSIAILLLDWPGVSRGGLELLSIYIVYGAVFVTIPVIQYRSLHKADIASTH